MTDTLFIKKLNDIEKDKQYGVSEIYVKEQLEKATHYSGLKQKQEMNKAKKKFIVLKNEQIVGDTISKKKYEELIASSPSSPIVSKMKEIALNKNLGIFNSLGIIAVCCGFVLFILGGTIKKWMHGIN